VPVMFIFLFISPVFSKIPRPITVKLCHIIRNWVHFIMQVQKFKGCSPKKVGGQKMYKILVDFIQLQTLIANICRMRQDIQNRKDTRSGAIPPPQNFNQ